jgi:DegV family protein with EDD domain
MKKVAVVTDSTAYIPKELVKKYDLRIAPQVLVWGNQTYKDGVDIQPTEFYTRLAGNKIMPSTSQASPQSFYEIFCELIDKQYEILAILLSEKLSGTIASAVQAREMVGSAAIEIFDSRTTAMAMGFQVLAVARAAEEGASMAECLALAENNRDHTGVVFAVDTLEFLHRGGRIGGASRFLGTALSLKPILGISDGQVVAIDKVRTRKKSLSYLLELLQKRIGDQKPVRIASLHANSEEDARYLVDEAVKLFNPVEVVFSEVSPVVGTHAGPGTVGLAYMAGV